MINKSVTCRNKFVKKKVSLVVNGLRLIKVSLVRKCHLSIPKNWLNISSVYTKTNATMGNLFRSPIGGDLIFLLLFVKWMSIMY